MLASEVTYAQGRGGRTADPESLGTELAEFRKWYAEFDAQAGDQQFEADINAGKLGTLGEAARREGKSKEL